MVMNEVKVGLEFGKEETVRSSRSSVSSFYEFSNFEVGAPFLLKLYRISPLKVEKKGGVVMREVIIEEKKQ